MTSLPSQECALVDTPGIVFPVWASRVCIRAGEEPYPDVHSADRTWLQTPITWKRLLQYLSKNSQWIHNFDKRHLNPFSEKSCLACNFEKKCLQVIFRHARWAPNFAEFHLMPFLGKKIGQWSSLNVRWLDIGYSIRTWFFFVENRIRWRGIFRKKKKKQILSEYPIFNIQWTSRLWKSFINLIFSTRGYLLCFLLLK